LAGISDTQLFLSRANWLDDLSLNAASIVIPSDKLGLQWSLGTRMLYSGDLQGFDAAGQVVEEASYYGLAFTSGLSRQFRSVGLSLGISVSYFREHLPLETGDGFAVNVGGSFRRGANKIDFYAANLGGTVSFEGHSYPVDSYYVFGYGRSFQQGWGKFDIGGQLVAARSATELVQLGIAYHMNRYFSLRGSLDHTFDEAASTGVPVSAGLGFCYGHLTLDYGYTPHEYFSNTHTFSVGFRFNGGSVQGSMKNSQALPLHTGINPASSDMTFRNGEDHQTANGTVQASQPATYEIVAGTHARLESAEAERRALELLNVPARIRDDGGKYQIVIESFDTMDKANTALKRYKKQGHTFTIAQN
jgi:hypothetical protein